MNGPVQTYNIRKPMTRDEFLALPNHIAAAYIGYLATAFGANTRAISRMLKMHPSNLHKELEARLIQMPNKGKVFNPSAEWDAFLHGGEVKTEQTPTAPEREEPAPVPVPVPAPAPKPLQFEQGQLTLSGPKGVVLQQIFAVLPDTVHLTVNFSNLDLEKKE